MSTGDAVLASRPLPEVSLLVGLIANAEPWQRHFINQHLAAGRGGVVPCMDCGTPCRATRCPTCRRGVDRARGSRQARGYGAEHEELRAAWAPAVEAGLVSCWRCLAPLVAGQPWHLGHDDADRGVYQGPECVPCNSATASRR